MPRKPKVSTLKRNADTAFSKWVRRRGFCERCSSRNRKLDCAHIIPRGNLNLRYHPYNALALCHVCHRFWNHMNPLDFADWVEEKYPKRYKYLMKNRHKISKISVQQYRDITKLYKDKLALDK